MGTEVVSHSVSLLDTAWDETTVGICGMRSSGWQVDYTDLDASSNCCIRSSTRLYSKRPKELERILSIT